MEREITIVRYHQLSQGHDPKYVTTEILQREYRGIE